MSVTTDVHQLKLTVNGVEVGNTLKDLEKGATALRKKIRELEVGSKEWVAATKEYGVVSKRIKDVKKEIDGVGTSMSAMRGLTDNLKGAIGALGIVMSATFVINFIKNYFSSATEAAKKFETSLDNLQSITGATGEEMKFFSEEAKNLGLTTTAGARDAVEAFKLIASAKPELLENKELLVGITKEAIALGDAAGMELPAAATALTDALNQFSAPAEEAGRYINVLAAGAKFGAAEIPEVTDALLKFGVSAASSNISIEESVALIETLAEKGTKGAEAGTALRNVLAKLSAPDTLPKEALKALDQAGVNMSVLSDKTKPLSERLNELAKIQGNASAITRVFGLENKNAAQILIENRGRVQELTQAVTGTKAAYEQAAINLDNYEGQQKLLNNTIEVSKIKLGNEFLPLLSSGMKAVIPFITKATAAFITFIQILKGIPQFVRENKDLFIALGVALLSFNAIQIATTASTLYYLAIEKARAIATKASAVAQRLLNAAMTANPIGLVIAAVGLLVAGFIMLYNRSEKVRAGIAGLAAAAVQIFQNIKNAAMNILGGVANLLMGVFTLDVDLIKKGLKSAFEGVKDMHIGLGKGVGAAFNKGYDEKLKAEAAEKLKVKAKEKAEKVKEAADTGTKVADAEINAEFKEKLKQGKEKRDKEREQREKDAIEAAKNIGKLRAEIAQQLEEDDAERRIMALKQQAEQEIEALKGSEEQKALQKKLILQRTWNEIDKINEGREAEALKKSLELQNRSDVAKADLAIINARGSAEGVLAASLEKLNLQMEIELQNTELTEEEKLLIKAEYALRAAELEDQFREDKRAKEIQVAESTTNYLMQGVQALNDFSKIRSDKEIDEAERVKNNRLKKLDQELKAGKISQDGYNFQKQQAEEEAAKKTNRLKSEQARKDKAIKVTEAIIAGLLSVLKAAPNPYMMAAMAILSGLTVAKIIATPVPQFKHGGRLRDKIKKLAFGGLIKGPSHEAGGLDIVDTQTGRRVANMEGDEFIINAGISKNPYLLAEAYNLNEKAKKYADGGPLNPLGSSVNEAVAATGGTAVSASNNNNFNPQEFAAMRREMMLTRRAVEDWPKKLKVYNVVQETEEGIKVVNQLKEEAEF